MSTDRKTKIDADTCTVVVVDVQNDFCHPEGSHAKAGADVSAYVEMVPRLAQFLTQARELRVPMVWIQTWRDDSTNSPVLLARRSLYLDPPELQQSAGGDEPGAKPGSSCIKGTWGADFYQVHPEPGEPISFKIRYNAFVGSSLETMLRTIGRPSLLFTGLATNVCVESTLRDAFFREFHVTLVEDCCASNMPGAHEATVETVRQKFGLVMTSSDITARWRNGAIPAPLSPAGSRPGVPRLAG